MENSTPYTFVELLRMAASVAAYDATNRAIAALRADGIVEDELPPALARVYRAAEEAIFDNALPARSGGK